TRVEKTIREIKESQADKERTLKARQKLEEYNDDANNGEKTDKVDKKIKELKKAEGRLLKYNPELKKSKKKTESKSTKVELEVGCMVKIEGMSGKGEVIRIDNKKIVVAFGLMQTTVDRKKITEITVGGKKKAKTGVVISGTVTKRKLEFKSEIDVRGKRAEEALVIVQQFIDDAVMVTSKEVRILHGKGNGVLRQLIRDYLKTIDVVQKVRDEHADRGGAGITIVELNYS
ncbi:MAG: Smr/MutS family protein, partial [Bacteroidales bacterium]|nr:Smr/MutS family protein [Bacteroidales bacterium]